MALPVIQKDRQSATPLDMKTLPGFLFSLIQFFQDKLQETILQLSQIKKSLRYFISMTMKHLL